MTKPTLHLIVAKKEPTDTISIRLPKALIRDIDKLAKEVGRSRSNYVHFLLTDTIRQLRPVANEVRRSMGRSPLKWAFEKKEEASLQDLR